MYKVIEDFRGSPDGATVTDYKKDDVVELSDELAEVALEEGWVKKVRKRRSKGDSSDDVDQTDGDEQSPGDEQSKGNDQGADQ